MRKAGRTAGKPRPKRLTKAEQELVDRMVADYRKAWVALLAVNKWREIR